ncbi:MAG TPA: DUF6798 domain-containing protein [Polyangiales bacterium]|nr:DUF6798 domain-containing protein [Polyangiales bacterium]
MTAYVVLYQVGYGFEVGDQLQYLLLPYREIFPNFLPGDWFTWQTSHYHATFSWIVRGLAALFGVERLPESVFALHMLNLGMFGYALLALSRALGFGLFEAAFALCGFAFVRQMGLAGAVLNHGALVPADLALPAFLLACAAYARSERLLMGAWLGVSGFMHANYAVLGPALLFGLELLRCRRRRELLQLVAAGGLYALIALPTLWFVLGSFLIRDAAPQAVAVTLFTRSPHHYDLFSLRLDEFYYGFGLCLIALPRTFGRVGAPEQRRVFVQLTVGLAALTALGALGSLVHVVTLSRLFTWRMSIPLFALWLMAAGAALRDWSAQRRWLQLLWLVAMCVGLTAFAQTDPLESSPWNGVPRAAAIAGALSLLGALCALGPWRRPQLSAAGVLLASASALVALSVTHSKLWQGDAFKAPRGLHWLDGKVVIAAPLRPLYAAVRDGTPHDARFLIPPGMSQFRMSARRAVFVDWKCAPMRGDEALEWQRRLLAAIGAASFPAVGYRLPRAADAAYWARPIAELIELARHEGLTHVLWRAGASAPSGTRRVLQSGRYAVLELLP